MERISKCKSCKADMPENTGGAAGMKREGFVTLSADAGARLMRGVGKHTSGTEKPLRSKYNASQTDIRLCDGTVKRFDSKKEAERYAELSLLERGGAISDLRCQVPFTLIPAQTHRDGRKERPLTYIADFTYRKDGELIVEDVKGYRDPKSAAYRIFAIKRKLMLEKFGISVEEV